MKTKLQLLFIGLVAAAVAPTAATAGYHVKREVYHYSTSMTWGSVSAARSSADSLQYIQCFDTGSYGMCQARDKSGVTRSCTTHDAGMRAAIRSVSDSSYIRFQHNTSNGVCALIDVVNSSMYVD